MQENKVDLLSLYNFAIIIVLLVLTHLSHTVRPKDKITQRKKSSCSIEWGFFSFFPAVNSSSPGTLGSLNSQKVCNSQRSWRIMKSASICRLALKHYEMKASVNDESHKEQMPPKWIRDNSILGEHIEAMSLPSKTTNVLHFSYQIFVLLNICYWEFE